MSSTIAKFYSQWATQESCRLIIINGFNDAMDIDLRAGKTCTVKAQLGFNKLGIHHTIIILINLTSQARVYLINFLLSHRLFYWKLKSNLLVKIIMNTPIVLHYLLIVCRKYNPFCITSKYISNSSINRDRQTIFYLHGKHLFNYFMFILFIIHNYFFRCISLNCWSYFIPLYLTLLYYIALYCKHILETYVL